MVIPFLKAPFFEKAHAHGMESITQKRLFLFHLLRVSTSWHPPALVYASDRHVNDVISDCVMSCQSRVMSALGSLSNDDDEAEDDA